MYWMTKIKYCVFNPYVMTQLCSTRKLALLTFLFVLKNNFS